MEHQVKSAKELRSRLKRKVTTEISKIKRALQRNESMNTVNDLQNNLDLVWDEFNEAHMSFAELINSDDTLCERGSVGGLTLDEYFETMEKSYDNIMDCIVDYKKKDIPHQCTLQMRSLTTLNEEIETMSKCNTDNTASSLQVLVDEVKQVLSTCHQLAHELSTFDETTLISDFNNLILTVELNVVRAKGIISASTNSFAFNSKSRSPPSVPPIQLTPTYPLDGESLNQTRSEGGDGLILLNAVSKASNTSACQSIITTPSNTDHLTATAVTHSNTQIEVNNGLNPIPHSSTLPHPSANLSTSMSDRRHKSRFTTMAPPKFSGERREWAEFRAVWRRYGELEYADNEERAWALKNSLRGKALECVKAIYVTQHDAYNRMWERLDSVYSNTSMCVQAVIDDLNRVKIVREGDLRGLIQCINEVELCHSQLEEVGQSQCISLVQVDSLTDRLPMSIQKEWMRLYHSLSTAEQLNPFPKFVEFLLNERALTIRLSERQSKRIEPKPVDNKSKSNSFHTDLTKPNSKTKSEPASPSPCAVHHKPGTNHSTHECSAFIKMTIEERLAALKQVSACFRCFGNHHRSQCDKTSNCRNCGKDNHHTLLCRSERVEYSVQEEKPTPTNGYHTSHSSSPSLLPILQTKVTSTSNKAVVFFDGGSSTSYITHSAAVKLKAQRTSKVTLDITSMGNIETQYHTYQYIVSLLTTDNSPVKIIAYGMDQITGPTSSLDCKVIKRLFPFIDSQALQRPSTEGVDILIGNDYFGLHPKREVARAGKNLSVMESAFGICLQGTHPELIEHTRVSTLIGTANAIPSHDAEKSALTHSPQHPQFLYSSTYIVKSEISRIDNFIDGEDLGTEVHPRCGSCRCTKCPIPGHSYSFQEEQELQMIRSGLRYEPSKCHWITKYPWIIDPNTLPDNYAAAKATLLRTERNLRKDTQWAAVYKQQIQDMVDRDVARKLTVTEIEEWKGPNFYISHLAVKNPKSTSTPVRIVFNSSQLTKGVSLNSALAKGPDSYLNNLLGILLRWREKPVSITADIKKMYNSIFLETVEQHCHRFLWRDLDCHKEPDIYVIQRVNMGDRPAAAISTEAIYQTATLFQKEYPRVAELLKHSTYVDDIVDSVDTVEDAICLGEQTEKVLARANFKVKYWWFSGDQSPRSIPSEVPPEYNVKNEGTLVLGVVWRPVSDTIAFSTSLNFSPKRRGIHTSDNICQEEIPRAVPESLTKRMVLEQTMRIFDPLGLLCPFTLIGKCLLRKVWSTKLDWDDPLPPNLRKDWVSFFQQLFEIENLRFDRCLRPANAVGNPILVIMSDGSDIAYGFVAYIRWQLQDGSWWCRIIMAKSRIAPLKRLTTPQMELNGAVLAKRGRRIIETEMRYTFDQVYHLVDSETVLCMLNKLSTRFRLYEGVRVSEIQAATNGDLSSWHWIEGKKNIADWLTRGHQPGELNETSEWFRGPDFLYQPIDQWGIKTPSDITLRALPGEKKAATTNVIRSSLPLLEIERFSTAKRVLWTLARIISILQSKTFKGGATQRVTLNVFNRAKHLLIAEAQKTIVSELESPKQGTYRRLKPMRNHQGIWVVGNRLSRYNTLAANATDPPQILLPPKHPYTKLLMHEAHCLGGHRGRDGTLARFRCQYWTHQGPKLARDTKNKCQLCRLHDVHTVELQMGQLPIERLRQAPPFNSVMLDLFGPYGVRGEVQKRTTQKAYGIMFTDLYSRAVHTEAVFGYDTPSFLLALTRFANLRGWPATVYSDPGSQLIGAEKEIKRMWSNMDRSSLYKIGTEKGLVWHFGPANSPWHQGAVESLVKAAKRAIKFTISNQRLSPSEFMALCYEISNLLNERPLGSLPSEDSCINVLTPNCLLLGRALASNPGNWDTSLSYKSSINLVNNIAQNFWNRWTELYAPTLMYQNKWHRSTANLKPGDIVVVTDSNSLRGRYHIAKVHKVFPGHDGHVRKVSLSYKNFRIGERISEYKGAPDVIIHRSAQKLALLVPAPTE